MKSLECVGGRCWVPEAGDPRPVMDESLSRRESRRAELRTLIPKFKAGTSTAADRERALFLLVKLALSEDTE